MALGGAVGKGVGKAFNALAKLAKGGSRSVKAAVKEAVPSATKTVKRTRSPQPGFFTKVTDEGTRAFSPARTLGTAGSVATGGLLASAGLEAVTGRGLGQRLGEFIGAPTTEEQKTLLKELEEFEEKRLRELSRVAEADLFRARVGTPFEQAFGMESERQRELSFLQQVALPAATELGISVEGLLGDIGRGSPFLQGLTAGERARLAEASTTTGPLRVPPRAGGNAELPPKLGPQAAMAGV